MTETPDAARPDDRPSEGGALRKRRERYAGTHPRRYEHKYKELAADPAALEKVRARGMTPAGTHVPILVDELLEALHLAPGARGVDATLGYGGHAERVLAAIAPGGELVGIDVDPLELERTSARLAALGHVAPTLRVQRTNFAALARTLGEIGWSDGVDFVYADLGLSSMQIDTPGRGFSFKRDEPLDMRMNPARGKPAAEWLARVDAAELERVLAENSDEPRAREIAAALTARMRRPTTTRALAEEIAAALRSRLDDAECADAVRRVFQALRIEVNDELGALDALLRQLPGALRSGGRAAILSFHSGEDRRVKKAFAAGLREGTYRATSDELVRPSAAERRSNPRSGAAKLRWAVRA
ncbi:MAG: 16S rRNA (cytosine(1402)-N(4))-methyltransferase [Planctomycetota bacterium]|nr:MAG: 16S rRNA (cytosine(1402)-N(4))-methyltransferase [Planctomycetota bacterium]